MKRFWTPTPKSALFDYLRGRRIILVVGPQRAGTTIASVMIANDLDYEYLRSEDFGSWEVFLGNRNKPCVIRCPEYTAKAHWHTNVDLLAVVIIRRPVMEIIASQERVGWGFEVAEMLNYPGYKPPVSKAKYDYWDNVQKYVLGDSAFEIEYKSLIAHPMWIPPERRQDFYTAQIEIGEPRGEQIQNPNLVKSWTLDHTA